MKFKAHTHRRANNNNRCARINKKESPSCANSFFVALSAAQMSGKVRKRAALPHTAEEERRSPNSAKRSQSAQHAPKKENRLALGSFEWIGSTARERNSKELTQQAAESLLLFHVCCG